MSLQDEERSPVFHERVSMLQKKGYRGFTVKKIQEGFSGVQISVKNNAGRIISESGETNEEAFKKIIDKIDLILEEPS